MPPGLGAVMLRVAYQQVMLYRAVCTACTTRDNTDSPTRTGNFIHNTVVKPLAGFAVGVVLATGIILAV